MSEKNASEGRIQWSRFFKKLSPYMIRKGLLYLKHYGPREFWVRLHERFEPEEIPYGPWYDAYVPDQSILDKQKKKKFAYAPLISIVVPAYRTPEKFLRQLIRSLQRRPTPTGSLSGKLEVRKIRQWRRFSRNTAARMPECAGKIWGRIWELHRIPMRHFPWQEENL